MSEDQKPPRRPARRPNSSGKRPGETNRPANRSAYRPSAPRREDDEGASDGGRGARRTPGGWDAIATWYDGWVGKGGSEHHKRLAIPTVMDLLQSRPREQVLDVGCGQGVLAPSVAETGASYTGVDVSPKLLELARQHHGGKGRFLRADAANLQGTDGLQAASFDAAVFLLSIQDMDPLSDVLESAAWVLKPGGRVVLLMTHPAFRIPRQSGWGFDEGRKLIYRRVDRYLTPLPVPMKQHASGVTISFHRPLNAYINGLGAVGLYTDRIEEVPAVDTGLKKQRDRAQEAADAEIPLFLGLRARKQ
ncbi:MAG: class I SAM-dependent methyltransferase [bacterium]|nr:class I SAM-dependent methyltransferase [bacterium]